MHSDLTLESLRNKTTGIQQSCLNESWQFYRENKEWIRTRILHQKLGKKEVINALQGLGGCVLYVTQERYALTPLGVLLTSDCFGVENKLVSYVEFVRDKFMANPEIEEIDGELIEKYILMTPNELFALKELLWLSTKFCGGGSRGPNGWTVRLPDNVDDFPEISDIYHYVIDEIIGYYDQNYPIYERERYQYLLQQKDTDKDTYWFMNDESLKLQLIQDWNEIQRLVEIQAWKSCLILCGGILEGLLVDVLSRHKEKALEIYSSKKKKVNSDLTRWNLSELVDVSIDLGIISKSAFHLSQAVREFRNLIHPGKQIRENIIVSKEEALIAINSVKICLREISDHCRAFGHIA